MTDYLMIAISRQEVESQDCSKVVSTLKALLETPEKAKMFKEQVDLGFSGYDEDSRELFEIPEVRNFVFKLDEEFPFWLFFLTKFGTGLQCLFLCMMPPYLTEKAKQEIFPQRLESLLENRWLPAMNYIGNYVGMTDFENEQLTERSVSYFTEGVFRLSRDRTSRNNL